MKRFPELVRLVTMCLVVNAGSEKLKITGIKKKITNSAYQEKTIIKHDFIPKLYEFFISKQ